MRGTLIRIDPSGATKSQTLLRSCTLQHLRAGLDGGLIELVPGFTSWHGFECCAFCDEEGKIKRLPVNHVATAEWEKCVGHKLDDVLVGPVVVVFGDPEFMEML